MAGKNVAVIGAGMTGAALAHYLSADGERVTLIERADRIGGLATWQDFGPFVWDRFYHVILPTDGDLVDFLGELGLADELRWKRTLTGLYIDQEFFSLSNNREFLRFPKLGLIDKARLAALMMYCARIDDWRRLEKIPVSDWLIRVGGRRTFEKLWRPLLLAKLGEHYERVSAVFIWSYIKRMFSARDRAAQREQLGYVNGGYRAVFDALEQRLSASGGTLLTNTAVERLRPRDGGGLWVRHRDATTADVSESGFDEVIFTGPSALLENVAEPGLAQISRPAGAVEYLGVLCMAVLTEKPLVPYYVTNIADPDVPFTGLIGMSNLIDAGQTDGLHLSYLPKYVHADDPLLERTDQEIEALFVAGLKKLFPDFDPRSVKAMSLQRARRVQPLQVLNYSERVPAVAALHPDLHVLNTAQFVNNTLNNNEVIKHVRGFVRDRHTAQRGAGREQRGVNDAPHPAAGAQRASRVPG